MVCWLMLMWMKETKKVCMFMPSIWVCAWDKNDIYLNNCAYILLSPN